jgi:Leucine rich repeat variant
VALHLLYRAGLSLEHLPTAEGLLWRKICSSQVRKEATASDANAPPCILRALAQEAIPQDAKSRMRLYIAIAHNPSTPPDVLTYLAQDAEEGVRQGVASNPSTPPEVLTRLVQDTDREARWSAAGNASLPLEVLTQLAQDADLDVRPARRVVRRPLRRVARCPVLSGLIDVYPHLEWFSF